MDVPARLMVSRIAVSARSLGPGRRVVIWVQGCTLGCRGCASTDTWDAQAGTAMIVAEVAHQLAALLTDHDGLTISGGEPFQQGPAVAAVLGLLDQRAALAQRDVLVFTGYSPTRARRRCEALWDRADAVVAGPYLPHRGGGGWLRASSNQRLVVKSDLARERYGVAPRPSMEVATPGDDLAMAGLPRPGDLERFRRRMRERGIVLEDGVSWQS